MQLDDAYVGYDASVCSCKNIVNSFISTEFRGLDVLNICKAFLQNLPPGCMYGKI